MFSVPILGVQRAAASLFCHLLNCIHLLTGAQISSQQRQNPPRKQEFWSRSAAWQAHCTYEAFFIAKMSQNSSVSEAIALGIRRPRAFQFSLMSCKKIAAALTIMASAQRQVNYPDWCSDIKCIPFGSRLVMPSNVPSQRANLWPSV